MMVIGLLMIILGFISINFTGLIPKANLQAISETLVGDISSQQLNAMLGDTNGQSGPQAYGVFFSDHQYVLFTGETYQPDSPANIAIDLGANLTFTNINFPNSILIFTPGSGEILNWENGPYSFVIRNTATSQEQQVQFNQYGVVTITKNY